MLIVRKLRLQRGWSQSELAEFSGLSVRTIQRIEKGAKPGLETIKSLAAVFDMEAADFQQEVGTMENGGLSIEEREALRFVQKVKRFYWHLFSYIAVIAVLFAANLVFDPGYVWAKWPALGWGIGVVLDALKTYNAISIFGPGWERKKVEKRLGRKL